MMTWSVPLIDASNADVAVTLPFKLSPSEEVNSFPLNVPIRESVTDQTISPSLMLMSRP